MSVESVDERTERPISGFMCAILIRGCQRKQSDKMKISAIIVIKSVGKRASASTVELAS